MSTVCACRRRQQSPRKRNESLFHKGLFRAATVRERGGSKREPSLPVGRGSDRNHSSGTDSDSPMVASTAPPPRHGHRHWCQLAPDGTPISRLRCPHLGPRSDDVGASVVHIDASAGKLHVDATGRWGRIRVPAADDTQKRQQKRQYERSLHAFTLCCSGQMAADQASFFRIGFCKTGIEQ
jgi:hypothetical protein